MNFSDKLIKIRTHNNLTQIQLAEKMDVSAQTVYRWENGDACPNIKQLKVLCEIFKVPSAYFLSEEPEHEQKKKSNSKDNTSFHADREKVFIRKVIILCVCITIAVVILTAVLGYDRIQISVDMGNNISVYVDWSKLIPELLCIATIVTDFILLLKIIFKHENEE